MWACFLRPHSLANGSAVKMIGALLTGCATGAEAMARELLTIRMCRHGLRLTVLLVVYHVPLAVQCSGDNCAAACTGNQCGGGSPFVVLRLLQSMWTFPFRPHSLANGPAAMVIGGLLSGFATGARAMVRKHLTTHMCCHGLSFSVTVVCLVRLSGYCTSINCASACTVDQCGGALPSQVPSVVPRHVCVTLAGTLSGATSCVRLWMVPNDVGLSTLTASLCK
jgi:hypothetical protein